MSKPRIFANCKAGCLWETVHKDDLLQIASHFELPLNEDGTFYCELGKEYKIFAPQTDGIFACTVELLYEGVGGFTSSHNIATPTNDEYAESFVFRLLKYEAGTSGVIKLAYEMGGQRYEETISGLTVAGVLSENYLKITGATRVLLYNNGEMLSVFEDITEAKEAALKEIEDASGGTISFDLTALGLADVLADGTPTSLQTDTAEIIAALKKGAVKFKLTAGGTPFSVIPSVVCVGGIMWVCSALIDMDDTQILGTIAVQEDEVSAWFSPLENNFVKKQDNPYDALFVYATVPFMSHEGVEYPLIQVAREIPTAYSIPLRDTQGRLKVGTPEEDEEAVPKKYLADYYLPKVTPPYEGTFFYNAAGGLTQATEGANGYVVPLRGANGEVKVGTPTADADATPKKYVDDLIRKASAVDLSAYESNGQIVETYADGTTKTTTVEFDENGNPIKITDGDGNVINITW